MYYKKTISLIDANKRELRITQQPVARTGKMKEKQDEPAKADKALPEDKMQAAQLPPTPAVPIATGIDRAISDDPQMVLEITPEKFYQGILYAEILGKPKSMRRGR